MGELPFHQSVTCSCAYFFDFFISFHPSFGYRGSSSPDRTCRPIKQLRRFGVVGDCPPLKTLLLWTHLDFFFLLSPTITDIGLLLRVLQNFPPLPVSAWTTFPSPLPIFPNFNEGALGWFPLPVWVFKAFSVRLSRSKLAGFYFLRLPHLLERFAPVVFFPRLCLAVF